MCKLKTCVTVIAVLELIGGLIGTVLFGFAFATGLLDRRNDDTEEVDLTVASSTRPEVPKEFIILCGVFCVSCFAFIVLALYLLYGALKENAVHCKVWLLIKICLTLASVIWTVYDFVTKAVADAISIGISIGSAVIAIGEIMIVAWYIKTLSQQNRVVQTIRKS